MVAVHTLLRILNNVCIITFAINILKINIWVMILNPLLNGLCAKTGLGNLTVDEFPG